MIKNLYEKSEIWFAVAWILGYCILASIGDNLSMSIGITKSVTLPILIILSVVLYLFVKKNGLSEKYGLCKPNIPASKMLFYFPILLLLTVNLWYGAELLENILQVLYAVAIGFMLVMIFYKTKSMIVCIAMHSILIL